MNYIGLNSWSLYRCPGQSTFDETSQQCLVKIPIDDRFDQMSSETSGIDGQIQRIARFFLAKPTVDYNPTNVYPPSQPAENGIFWSHGSPLMKFDEQPMHQPPSIVDPKLTFVNNEHPYPEPVSEGKIKFYSSSLIICVHRSSFSFR